MNDTNHAEAAHTPGPWGVHHEKDCTGYPVFYIHGFSGEEKRDEQVLDANARLIASAPDLLKERDELRAELLAICNALPLEKFADEDDLDAAYFVDECNAFLEAMQLARTAINNHAGKEIA